MTHTLREIPERIRARQIVKGNSLTARPVIGRLYSSTGYLPEPFAIEFRRAIEAGAITYVVYSYGTPIAWELNTGVIVIPAQSYSVTTSRHQGIVRRAFAGSRIIERSHDELRTETTSAVADAALVSA